VPVIGSYGGYKNCNGCKTQSYFLNGSYFFMTSFLRKLSGLFKKKPSKKKEPKTLTFPEIGWKITIPREFRLLDNKEADAFFKHGWGRSEKSIFEGSDALSPKILFVAQVDSGNVFHGYMVRLNEKLAAENVAAHKESSKKHLLDIYKQKYHKHPRVTVKAITDTMQIGDIEFESLDIMAGNPEHVLLQSSHYFNTHRGYYISIGAVYAEDEVGKEIFHALLKSKFDV
jgi:hypothetical protein